MAQDPLDKDKARSDFLIAVYNQMMGDINRHIIVVWQSVAVLVSAFAAWSLIEKSIISLDIAVSLIIGIAIWLIGNVYDAAYWYNRNLVIIANIERQFLRQEDLKEIHYYFGAHRKASAMLTHLKLQLGLAVGVAGFVFALHLFDSFVPAWKADGLAVKNFIPLGLIIGGGLFWGRCHRITQTKYKEFLQNSPGKEIKPEGVRYGIGHPTDES